MILIRQENIVLYWARSNIVGRPMSILMARKASPGSTVTLCHSKDKRY